MAKNYEKKLDGFLAQEKPAPEPEIEKLEVHDVKPVEATAQAPAKYKIVSHETKKITLNGHITRLCPGAIIDENCYSKHSIEEIKRNFTLEKIG